MKVGLVESIINAHIKPTSKKKRLISQLTHIFYSDLKQDPGVYNKSKISNSTLLEQRFTFY